MSSGDMTGGRGARTLVGEFLPGGRKGRLEGDSGREVAGVVGRDSLILDAGRAGGAITPSLLTWLGLLGTGEGHGEI